MQTFGAGHHVFRVRVQGGAAVMAKVDILREYITEVLAGFDNKNAGKDGIGGNLHYMGSTTGDAGVRQQNGNVLTDEEAEDDERDQDVKKAACCLILSHDGHILAVSRKDDPSMWGFPGGKVDGDEDPADAAARALQEETGWTATDLHLVHRSMDSNGFEVSTYACEADGEINTPESGLVRWVKPSVLLDPNSSPWVDYNREVFTRVGLVKSAR